MRTVWIVTTPELGNRIVGVFATREALDYEYPTMREAAQPRTLEIRRVTRQGREHLYATEYPLIEAEFAR